MPQGPIATADANLVPQGAKSVKNITSATVLKSTPGTILGAAVTSAGSAGTGAFYDQTVTSGTAIGTQTMGFAGSAAVGNIAFNPIPHNAGIVVVPGTGQALTVWYI